MEIPLTNKHRLHLQRGKPIQLSAAHISGGNIDHMLTVSDETMKKYNRAKRLGKGFRMKPSEFSGGSLRSVLKASKKFVKKHAGKFVESVKKAVPKEAVQSAISSALMAGSTFIGQPELGMAASAASNKLIDKGYSHNFEKPLLSKRQSAQLKTGGVSGLAKNFAKDKINKEINMSKADARNYFHDLLEDYLDDDDEAQVQQGGSLKSIGKTFKKIGNKIEKGFQPVTNYVKNNARDLVDVAAGTVISALPGPLQSAASYGVKKGLDQSGLRNGGALRRPKLVKGSQEAKDFMAQMRAKRKSGGSIISIGSRGSGIIAI